MSEQAIADRAKECARWIATECSGSCIRSADIAGQWLHTGPFNGMQCFRSDVGVIMWVGWAKFAENYFDLTSLSLDDPDLMKIVAGFDIYEPWKYYADMPEWQQWKRDHDLERFDT